MDNIQIIAYRRRYLSEVTAMILKIQQQEFGINISLHEQDDLLHIDDFYQKGNGNFWLALHNGLVVGTIALLDIGAGVGALRKMFVDQRFRGKQTGVAQRLLSTVLHWSSEKGFNSIYLGTTDKFKAAHRFYEKNGFTAIPDSALPVSFPLMKVDSVFYKLHLSNQS